MCYSAGTGLGLNSTSGRSLGSPAALPETVPVAVHLDDVNVMSEPVQQSVGQSLRTEHLGPLVERQVRCHEDRASLVAQTEDLEEILARGGIATECERLGKPGNPRQQFTYKSVAICYICADERIDEMSPGSRGLAQSPADTRNLICARPRAFEFMTI